MNFKSESTLHSGRANPRATYPILHHVERVCKTSSHAESTDRKLPAVRHGVRWFIFPNTG